MKTKFEQARDEKAKLHTYCAQKLSPMQDDIFCEGADWGASYERARAKVLVDALENIRVLSHQEQEIDEALATYNTKGE